MRRDLTKLLNPRSIAIIGASRSPEKLGFIVLKNIQDSGFKGAIYPVNPKAEDINGLKCFAKYADIPETPELAIIALPSNLVINSLKEIALKGTKDVVIFSAGFKEIGYEGADLENQLIKVAEDFGLNILGPNCLGFVNNLADINATFGQVIKNVGNLRFISQSGAIASSIFDFAHYSGLGFSEFVTLGNKAVLSENDFLEYWRTIDNLQSSMTNVQSKKNIEDSRLKIEDSKGTISLNDLRANLTPEKEYFMTDKRLSSVRPIGMYLESIVDGEDFLNIASQITLKDPIFVLKPGKSTAAKKAMQSHTGSIAGEDHVLDAALKQAGIVRCDGVEDMFDLARAFSWENAPEGPNVAIVSNAGGPAVISADFVEQEGLQLAQISDVTKKMLEKYLPRASSFLNPIDVLGDALAARYATAIDTVLGQYDVHAMIIILTPQIMTQIYSTAELIGRLSDLHKKPILCAFMGGSNIEKGEKILNMYKIPTFRFPERAIKALGKMWWWKKNSLVRSLEIRKLGKYESSFEINTVQISRVREILKVARKVSGRWSVVGGKRAKSLTNHKPQTTDQIVLNPFQSNEILKSWYINTPPTDVITHIDDGIEFAEKYGYPVVLKLSSNKILHKSDLGGVIVNINSNAKLESSFHDLKRRISNLDEETKKTVFIQIQKQVPSGVEVILGIKKDPNFGHVMMFGAGGTLAEVIQDRNLRLIPVDKFDASKLVWQSKINKILKGYRGEKEFCLPKLYYVMEKLSELAETFPEIEEFEINPLIITHEDVWAVDGKMIIR